MSIKISNKDIYWSYFAQFFSLASGVITLPLILKVLSEDEIGMNYLIISVGSLVSLFDFGFSAQFGRTISYIFGGAQELRREGVSLIEGDSSVNYQLLSIIIKTARYLFARLAFIVIVFMLIPGTFYIYKVTNGFTTVDNALIIWTIYSLSIFFNIFYTYYSSLLIGKGLIKETQKAVFYSKITQVLLIFLLLYFGLGLLGVVIANLISPFVNRYFSHKFFFTKLINDEISKFEVKKSDISKQFNIVWHNAKKLGIVFLGSHAINKLGIFIAGLYLTLKDVASYGLMIQLFAILTALSSVFFSTYQPRFSSLRVSGDKKNLSKEFAYSMNVFYILFIAGSCGLIILVPYILNIMGANATMPSLKIMILFALIILLESNHSNFATLIVTNNEVPFVYSSLISGFFITVGNLLILKYTGFGLLGLVLVQGIVQLCYNNWKWPMFVLVDLGISFQDYLKIGLTESLRKLGFHGRK